jgi:transcriptional regulator with XRE-family HTH domain
MPVTLDEPAPRPELVHFGRRLRHWRLAAGLTQAELGRRLAYDHSFISRVERSSRWPTHELAVRCDELLGAGGELVAQWRRAARERSFSSLVG